MPPTPQTCNALHAVKTVAYATARADLDMQLEHRDFPRYRAQLVLLLTAFDRRLAAGAAGATGPLRTHLVATRTAVEKGLRDLRAASGAAGYDAFTGASNGWIELSTAQQLLAGHRGGGLTQRS